MGQAGGATGTPGALINLPIDLKGRHWEKGLFQLREGARRQPGRGHKEMGYTHTKKLGQGGNKWTAKMYHTN